MVNNEFPDKILCNKEPPKFSLSLFYVVNLKLGMGP